MAQYFNSTNKKGELYELSEELNSTQYDRKREAVKKVIAHMTIGKDVSPLFQQVIKCLEYPEIELKKLVYLYIINYSKTRPDDAIMVINLFRKDVQNKANPLLRALAVRTMGCLKVHKLNEYLAEPLKQSLNDQEPYVRKTAALCVPKVCEISQELVDQAGLIEIMQKLMQSEANPLVLANIIVGLNERLLLAVNECMEWGQVFIMDYLVNYVPEDSKEAEQVIERILPRLSHINPSVVFAAVKVILKYLDYLNSAEIVKQLCNKLTPSLVSLLSWNQHEIKFVILKCISHIIAKRPNIMDKDVKCFFCNFNEPYYIKNQKLDILAKICDLKNYEVVLDELKLYVSESDTNFVRKSIKAVCSIALRFKKGAEKALTILIQLIKNINEAKLQGEQYVQEIIISMQKMYRKYPNLINHENGLKELVEILDQSLEELAKASAAWIIGEFAEEIPKCIDLINTRIDNFKFEERAVQLEILTAAVKIFVKYPEDGKNFIQKLLETAAYETQNPDVRDRSFIYWRMLSSDPERTKNTVLCEKPEIEEEEVKYEQQFLETMINTLGMISSVYSKLPAELINQSDKAIKKAPTTISKDVEDSPKNDDQMQPNQDQQNQPEEQKKEEIKKEEVKEEDLLDFDSTPVHPKVDAPKQQQKPAVQQQQQNIGGGDIFDLLDIQESNIQKSQPQQQQQQQKESNTIDLFDDNFNIPISTQQVQGFTQVPMEEVFNPNQKGKNGNQGLKIDAAINRQNQNITIKFKIQNNSLQLLNNFDMQLKPNFFCLQFDKTPNISIPPGQTVTIDIPLSRSGKQDTNQPAVPLTFLCGLKTNIDIFYFSIKCMFHTLLDEQGQLTKEQFRDAWKVNQTNELAYEIASMNQQYKDNNALKNILKNNNIFFVAQRMNDLKQQVSYYSLLSYGNLDFLLEITVPSQKNPQGCTVSCISKHKNLTSLVLQCVDFILTR